MRIYVASFDENLTTRGKDSGHLITFQTDLVFGEGLLVAIESTSPSLCRQQIWVETDQIDIVEARALLSDEPHVYRLTALPDAGNYEAIGKLHEEILDNGEGFHRVSASVGDTWFHWITQDVSRGVIKLGEWIGFTIIGLKFGIKIFSRLKSY